MRGAARGKVPCHARANTELVRLMRASGKLPDAGNTNTPKRGSAAMGMHNHVWLASGESYARPRGRKHPSC